MPTRLKISDRDRRCRRPRHYSSDGAATHELVEIAPPGPTPHRPRPRAAHVANHDLRWLAASRAAGDAALGATALVVLRRRMRLDQEALADAAAAELTSRQSTPNNSSPGPAKLPAHPAMHLSAAVGLWESPSQLRQRIVAAIDDAFHNSRNCSRGWHSGPLECRHILNWQCYWSLFSRSSSKRRLAKRRPLSQ